MILGLLAVIVIAADLVMVFVLDPPTQSSTPPNTVVRMKIPPMPKAEPEKADGLQPSSELEGNAGTESDQSLDDSLPTEPDAAVPEAPSSQADASALVEAGSAQINASEETDINPQSEFAVEPAEASKTVASVAEELKEPDAQDAPEPTVAATLPESKALFTVQVGGYLTKAYADAKLEELKKLGYPADIIEITDEKQQLWHLVCFGRFQTFAEASNAMAAFKTKENMSAVVIRPKSW